LRKIPHAYAEAKAEKAAARKAEAAKKRRAEAAKKRKAAEEAEAAKKRRKAEEEEDLLWARSLNSPHFKENDQVPDGLKDSGLQDAAFRYVRLLFARKKVGYESVAFACGVRGNIRHFLKTYYPDLEGALSHEGRQVRPQAVSEARLAVGVQRRKVLHHREALVEARLLLSLAAMLAGA